MRRLFVGSLLMAAVASLAVSQFAFEGRSSEAAEGPRVVSAFGLRDLNGETLIVHVSALVPPGRSPQTVADAALAAHGARPATPADLQSAAFTTTGLLWDQFSDSNPGNDFVTQYYNPADQPASVDGETALTNAQATWTDVSSSSFAFAYGGTTSRCPSLIDECPGAQAFDGFNDVIFTGLKGPCNAVLGCTLGVTVYGTSADEADMALNSKVAWDDGCTGQNGSFDAQTVLLHEDGHVAGLGHSEVPQAVMYASYGGVRCDLHQDDIDGLTALYPAGGAPAPTSTPTDAPAPTNTPAPTDTPTSDATPTPTPADEEPFCPPGWQRQNRC